MPTMLVYIGVTIAALNIMRIIDVLDMPRRDR